MPAGSRFRCLRRGPAALDWGLPPRCAIMSQPQPPKDPNATVKMVPGAMFETHEFTKEEIAERLAQRLAEADKAQDGAIQPPPSTSSPR